MDLLHACKNQTEVSKILRISFTSVHNIMERAVERGLSRRDSSKEIEYIGIDEKSYKKGHKYLSILTDLDSGTVIDISKCRTQQSAKDLIRCSLTPIQQSLVNAVCMDMWQSYMNAVSQCLPNADIVHDRFHICKYINESVDKTRKLEKKNLDKHEEENLLTGTKYIFLKNPENLTEKQRSRFEALQEQNLVTCQAWRIKENFKGFFESETINDGKFFFAEWYEDVKKSGIPQIQKVAKMLIDHSIGLLNYIKHRITNSIAERINGSIQSIRAIARGFRSFQNYRLSILFYLGGLNLYP